MKRTSQILFLLATLAIYGCQTKSSSELEPIAEPAKPISAKKNPINSIDGYISASQMAIRDAADFEKRVTFTSSHKTEFLKATKNAITRVQSAENKPTMYKHEQRDLFMAEPALQGFGIIEKSLEFRIQDACENENWDEAISLYLTANKMAIDLSNTDVLLSSTGISISNTARDALIPFLDQIPASKLSSLSQSLINQLTKFATIDEVFDNEQENMLQGIQFVQNCYADKNYNLLNSAFGKSAKPAITYLKDIEPEEINNYFKGMEEELVSYIKYNKEQASLTSIEREKITYPKEAHRPWKRFSSHLFGQCESYLNIRDLYLARTKLMAISAQAFAHIKGEGKAHPKLDFVPEPIKTDPYSGKAFAYRASGRTFKTYSVGRDGRDDAGETDELGESPDLRLKAGY